MSCLAAESFGIGCFGGGMRSLWSSFSMDSETFGCRVDGVVGGFAGDLLFARVCNGWMLGVGVLLMVIDVSAFGDAMSV